jgi:PHP family Zn ribbon phosphoesterase
MKKEKVIDPELNLNKGRHNPLFGDMSRLRCLRCRKSFGIENDYMGVITCPYCGEHIEG